MVLAIVARRRVTIGLQDFYRNSRRRRLIIGTTSALEAVTNHPTGDRHR
jgi:hypothetical protein